MSGRLRRGRAIPLSRLFFQLIAHGRTSVHPRRERQRGSPQSYRRPFVVGSRLAMQGAGWPECRPALGPWTTGGGRLEAAAAVVSWRSIAARCRSRRTEVSAVARIIGPVLAGANCVVAGIAMRLSGDDGARCQPEDPSATAAPMSLSSRWRRVGSSAGGNAGGWNSAGP
jgi:hypothetical protein